VTEQPMVTRTSLNSPCTVTEGVDAEEVETGQEEDWEPAHITDHQSSKGESWVPPEAGCNVESRRKRSPEVRYFTRFNVKHWPFSQRGM
jgi:hypothetical protein